jgi:two-component system osmolarity sensor histidine kinase EnvZ
MVIDTSAPLATGQAAGPDDLHGSSAFAKADELTPGHSPGLSLFWRTFLLLSVLLVGSVMAWLKTLSAVDFEPRALQTANQITALVNLSRVAVLQSERREHGAMRDIFSKAGGIHLVARQASDRLGPTVTDAFSQRIEEILHERLGPGVILNRSVNDTPGMWVSFALGPEQYWLALDPAQVNMPAGKTWLPWLGLAIILSLTGAALIARLINKPIRQLWLAASRIRVGDYESSFLDETAATNEIREVNIGFNRMAQRLAKIEQDRAIMLAGISHDLRTPLARLRLETELSVSDQRARAHMANDIEQLDRIIDKFLDYARPVPAAFRAVSLNAVIEGCLYALGNPSDMQVTLDLRGILLVQGDATELSRALANLLENARRYGKSPDGVARIEISGRKREHWVLLRVRDHGNGVAAELLPKLKQPFFRGDLARTSVSGAGLGLSIVDMAIQRIGGSFVLTRPTGGGLSANIRLNPAH